MKLRIDIDLENDAFAWPDAGRELETILSALGAKLRDWSGAGTEASGRPGGLVFDVMDSSGNHIGTARTVREKYPHPADTLRIIARDLRDPDDKRARTLKGATARAIVLDEVASELFS